MVHFYTWHYFLARLFHYCVLLSRAAEGSCILLLSGGLRPSECCNRMVVHCVTERQHVFPLISLDLQHADGAGQDISLVHQGPQGFESRELLLFSLLWS